MWVQGPGSVHMGHILLPAYYDQHLYDIVQQAGEAYHFVVPVVDRIRSICTEGMLRQSTSGVHCDAKD